MTASEIRKRMREIKEEMKTKGIRRISCFNGGLSGEAYRLNSLLFKLSVDLDDAARKTAKELSGGDTDN
jgi:hypothetical protein